MSSTAKHPNRRRAMSRDPLAPVRKQLVASFHDESVHASFEKVFADIPTELRGVRPEGQPFTLWQLLEHLRLCVVDFLDYCRDRNYVEPKFPEGFWPKSESPRDAEWDRSWRGYRASW